MKRLSLLVFLPALLAVLAIRCTPSLSPGATQTNYIRLLNNDPLTALSVVRASSDGNVLFLYTAEVPGDTVTSIELTKTDPNGSVLWTKHFGTADNYQAGDFTLLTDGSIAIAGTHSVPPNNREFVFLHLDESGGLLLHREYWVLPQLTATTIRQSNSGELILGGQGKDPLNTNPSSQLSFLRLSSAGDSLGAFILSTGTSGSTLYKISGMSNCENNAALGVGSYSSGVTTYRAIFTLKSAPDSILYSGYLSLGAGTLRSIAQTGPASYILAGDSNFFGAPYFAWVGEVDAPFPGNGGAMTTNWGRGIIVGKYGSITSIIQTADKGLAATGFAATNTGDTSILVFRFDAKGNDVWPHKTYSYAGGDVPSNIVELTNGDLILGGVTTSFGSRASGARQIFLLHLKADGTPAY